MSDNTRQTITSENSSDDLPPIQRGVLSFVRRQGRMTDAQQRALDDLWPQFGVELTPDTALDFNAIFPRPAPVIIEIGFGDGRSLVHQAAAYPEFNYLGIEVHRPGVGRCLQGIHERGLTNLKLLCTDGIDVLRNNIADKSIHGLQLFFPDPWPKKRHHKRRMVQAGWVALVARKMQAGGRLHLATDWQPYAEHMMEVVSANADFSNIAGSGQFTPRPPERIETKFEQRGQRLGHGVWDMIFLRR